MNLQTVQIIQAALKSDPTIAPDKRALLLGFLKNGDEPLAKRVQRIVRRSEAAQTLSVSLRMVDKLSSEGVLRKRILPGRKRGCGFLESDVLALIGERSAV